MMVSSTPSDGGPDFARLTAAERRQLSFVLDGVSTRTLLNSLVGVERDSDDAQLIIAALLERIPEEDAADSGDVGDQAPVIPI